MMRIYILGICLLMYWTAKAQQRPHYTQHILNNYIINPAIAGIENYIDVKISHRHQWVGVQDAPITTYLTVHGAIGKKDDRITTSSFLPEGENPRGNTYWQNYESAKPHHGWGVQIINDRTGPLNRFSGYATYAYHLGLSTETSLAGGFSFGLTNNSLNAGKLDFGMTNPVDPAVVGSGYLNKLRPDLNFGLWLYGANYFVGASMLQLLPQGLVFSNDTLKRGNETFPHSFLTVGYRSKAGDDFNILSSAVFRHVSSLPVGIDLSVKVQYQDRFWFGGGYRIKDGFFGMLGLSISSVFNVAYAYDYTTSKLQTYSKGTHEIMLGFMLGNKWGDMCPRNVW